MPQQDEMPCVSRILQDAQVNPLDVERSVHAARRLASALKDELQTDLAVIQVTDSELAQISQRLQEMYGRGQRASG